MNCENKNRQSKRFKLPIHVYLSYLIVATMLFTGVTFSKYVVSATGGDSAAVAAFGNLELYEVTDEGKDTDGDSFTIIPGVDIVKEAVVEYSTEQNSEMAAYVFVKITTDGWQFDGQKTYSVVQSRGAETITALKWNVNTKDGWTHLLDTGTGSRRTSVFCRTVAPNDTLISHVIEGDAIEVSPQIYYSEMTSVETAAGNIVFQAYAVQVHGFANAQEAWEAINGK